MILMPWNCRLYNLVPRVFVPLDQRSENESSGSNHFEMTKEITEFCPSGITAQSASMAHGCSRALVFRPLVKGNEDSGNEIAGFTDQRTAFAHAQGAILQRRDFNLHVERARKIPYSRS